MEPVERDQQKPDRRQIVHLPDRRPLLGITSDRANRDLAIRLGQRPVPLVVVGEIPGPPRAQLVIPLDACTVVTAVSAAVKLATSNQETSRWFDVMSIVRRIEFREMGSAMTG